MCPAHELVPHEPCAYLAHDLLLVSTGLASLFVEDLAVPRLPLQRDGSSLPVGALGGPGEDECRGGVGSGGLGLGLAAHDADEVLHLLAVGVGEALDEIRDVVPARSSEGERLDRHAPVVVYPQRAPVAQDLAGALV